MAALLAPLRLPASAAASLLLFLVLRLPTTALSRVANTTTNHTYSFPSFAQPEANNTNLTVLNDANIDEGALQLTPNTPNNAGYLVNKSGRVVLTHPFTLWREADLPATSAAATGGKHVASFNTTFTVNVNRVGNATPGEGFAFVIVPALDMPNGTSDAGFLGLTNGTIDGDPNNHLVAVEFDNVKQSYDPDDNHVGLDVNGVVSNASASLSPFGIVIAPLNATNYTVWIDYDGGDRHIWVYMAVQGQQKPSFSVLNSSLDLGAHLLQESFFGFSASTGTGYQLHCILSWSLTIEDLSQVNHDRSGMAGWMVGLAIGLAVFVVIVTAGLLGWRVLI